MTDVVISSAARTAIKSYGRSLKDVPPTELGAIAAREVLSRAQIEPRQVEGVFALEHPIAATGAAITAKCLAEMERKGHELGLATLRIDGGQGIALLPEAA